ncbi:hypothetical protein H5410_002550, partial [Solanum commersonii]
KFNIYSYVKNDVGTTKVTQKLAGKKKLLVSTKVIANTFVDFVIVPSKGVKNLYTIKLKNNEDKGTDPYGLNRKYYDMIHGWKAERRQCQNGKCEMFLIFTSMRGNTLCRFTRDVRRYIFQGYENLKEEFQQETNAIIESMIGVGEKKSKKRDRESLISEREFAVKKHKINGPHNHDKSKTEKFLNDVLNNLMN